MAPTGRDYFMPKTLCKIESPCFRGLFPDWSGPLPWSFFMTEQLLEARRESMFPTNGAGPDEDVNVYLAGLLADFLTGHHDPRVTLGADSVFFPREKADGARTRADHYRVNADHRLLYLGLMDRGDGLRRRRIHFGMTAEETRTRDMGIGRSCYQMATDLMEGKPGFNSGLAQVLRKLETNYEDYIHVLGVLATRRFGLGAVLSDRDLAGLFDLAG
jgi:hypothetical protein